MTMQLDQQFAALQKRLAETPNLGQSEVNAACDFAIDANASGRAELSLALLGPLADRMPSAAKIWQLLGLAWREEQEMEKAVAAFDRAATLAPQDPRIALGKAQVAFETGRRSAHLFKAVRAVAPNDGELALSAAAALVDEGKPAVGERLIADFLAREPGWLRGLDALATMRWMAGDTENFDRAFAESVKQRPQDMALRLGWYRAASQVADWTKAETIIADCRREFGPRAEFDATEAYVATEKGEDDRAEALFAAAASLDDPGTKVSHVRHCLRTGRTGQAEQIALALAKTPAAATIWPYLSLIWRLKGDARAAWLDGDPPFIGQFDLPVSDAELAALAERLRALHLTTYHPPEQSLRGGTQTQGHLFLRLEPEIVSIRSAIATAVRDYVDVLPPFVEGHPLLGIPRGAVHFAGAWSVRLAATGFHVVHTHPIGWISSAFYVALPENMGGGKAGWLQLGAPPPDLRLDMAPYAEIEPKPGRLALFPSTMWHGTIPFDDGERLTIAFDMSVPTR
jgi:tetratricopeptide (TPR) repeat protein